MPMDMNDAEAFESHFVKPLVDALRDEVRPLVARVTTLEGDVKSLKANQAKALVGWTLFVTGCTLLFDQIKSWLFAHLRGH